ncbi:glycoside hydrolase family 25 protein [Paraoerskovia marina]|uniref:glycoside hydrolase family 25 protein n=1 Tax=Paraoerskovia marina TaxID=545619 RepID=UPI0004928D87|nr:GH25 family lysozyme [Paraoerskovia marina]
MSDVARHRSPRRRLWWVLGGIVVAVILVVATLAALVWNGVLWPTRTSASHYDVRGVDVSSYQGDIDWDVLAGQDLDFAFIKSTEGSSHTDPEFEGNWADALETDLVVGAYHFMSFESPGETQLENIIENVPAEPGTLAPVVDLEYYGEFVDTPPSVEELRAILDPLLDGIEEHYGQPAILYTTESIWGSYLSEGYEDTPLWIRSVYETPDLPLGTPWTFWQYSDHDKLDGYSGEEEYIDMNVFRGSLDELDEMTLTGS